MLKIGAGAGYEDGDIVHAFHDAEILAIHAEQICLPRPRVDGVRQWQGLLGGSLAYLPPGSLAQACCELVFEFRYERISASELRITRLRDDEQRTVRSGKSFTGFDGRPQRIDVALATGRMMRTLASPGGRGRPVFGADAIHVTWYGGRRKRASEYAGDVWDAIEAVTEYSRSTFGRAPLGRMTARTKLMVPTLSDFTDARKDALESSEIDETDPDNPVVIRKRRHRVDWEGALGLDAAQRAQVRDKSRAVDLRDVLSIDDRVIEAKR
jgi:hypothetical protein